MESTTDEGKWLVVIDTSGGFKAVEFAPDERGSSLDQLQALVGGYIEHVDFDPRQMELRSQFDIWLNEEGKLLGLARNAVATKVACLADDDYIVGPVVISRVDAEGRTTPLSTDDVRFVAETLEGVGASLADGGVMP